LTALLLSASSGRFSLLSGIDGMEIRVGIEIENREDRNKFGSWVTPFWLNMNLLF
jgi:hypothetical protein